LVFTHAPAHNVVVPAAQQVLDRQTPPAVHAWPQLPQFAGSLVGSTHVVPPQSSVGAVHVVEHTPAEHFSIPVHAFPHVPQFDLSTDVSTHTPPHKALVPDGQHVLEKQMSPAAQTLPHAPQFDVSLVGSTHVVPPQSSVGATHFDVHLLAVHVSIVVHVFPQAPQFAGSLVMSTQVVPQEVFPVGHASAPSESGVSIPELVSRVSAEPVSVVVSIVESTFVVSGAVSTPPLSTSVESPLPPESPNGFPSVPSSPALQPDNATAEDANARKSADRVLIRTAPGGAHPKASR
jgi:hypothetical protein